MWPIDFFVTKIGYVSSKRNFFTSHVYHFGLLCMKTHEPTYIGL